MDAAKAIRTWTGIHHEKSGFPIDNVEQVVFTEFGVTLIFKDRSRITSRATIHGDHVYGIHEDHRYEGAEKKLSEWRK